MHQQINSRTAFVSGGTSGLGLSIVEHFVDLGYSIVFCSRNLDAVKALEEKLKLVSSEGQRIVGFECDVSNSESVIEMFKKIHEFQIEIDVLICNAGVIGPIDRFLESDMREWKNAFDVNLYGTLNLISQSLGQMLKNRHGRIIHISGGGATAPLAGMTSYSASKVAAVRLVETLSIEYRDSGVTFNSISPGLLKTRLLDQMLIAGPSKIGSKLFTRSTEKSASPKDSTAFALDLIEFLSSDNGAGVTGKLVSAEWDNWSEWVNHLEELQNSDAYTLRRIIGQDRNLLWGDL
jgi:NAD(P)-dependent dehydrogenase (short-subunit alcohol dehydrogenase family)